MEQMIVLLNMMASNMAANKETMQKLTEVSIMLPLKKDTLWEKRKQLMKKEKTQLFIFCIERCSKAYAVP